MGANYKCDRFAPTNSKRSISCSETQATTLRQPTQRAVMPPKTIIPRADFHNGLPEICLPLECLGQAQHRSVLLRSQRTIPTTRSTLSTTTFSISNSTSCYIG